MKFRDAVKTLVDLTSQRAQSSYAVHCRYGLKWNDRIWRKADPGEFIAVRDIRRFLDSDTDPDSLIVLLSRKLEEAVHDMRSQGDKDQDAWIEEAEALIEKAKT